MKMVEYTEDLCKTYFVITVLDTATEKRSLEKRRWTQCGYDSPDWDMEYSRHFDYSSDPSGEKYVWLDARSVLVATAEATPRWTDRQWQDVA